MDLFKGNIQKDFDVVVCVGNGAITNGSIPLRNAIDKLIQNDPQLVKKLRSSNSESFHQLAILSYKFRIEKTFLFKRFFKDPVLCLEPQIANHLIQNKIITGYLNLRKDIAHEFVNSHHLKLNIDKEIQEIIGEECLYLTTNWDNVLWSDPNIQNLIHIHGRCDGHDSLVFPTELLIEELMYDLNPCLNNISKFHKTNIQIISDIFRDQFLRDLGNAIIEGQKKVIKAKKIIIWGFSLADYDADINAMLAVWEHDDQSELWVINPDKNVLFRAIALTGCQNAKLYDPLSKLVFRIEDI